MTTRETRPITPTTIRRSGTALVAIVMAGVLTACGTASATSAGVSTTARPAASTASTRPTASAQSTASAAAAIDRYTALARRRYDQEVSGSAVHAKLLRVARDPTLLRTLRSGNVAALRSYVGSQFKRVWYHWHVSRMRITSGSRNLVEVGVQFALAGQQQTLRDANGRPLATLQVSVQDEIGIVKAMRRKGPVDLVILGRDFVARSIGSGSAGHVVRLLPASRQAPLPTSGTVTISGRRYLVRSFQRQAWLSEPVTVSVLMRG